MISRQCFAARRQRIKTSGFEKAAEHSSVSAEVFEKQGMLRTHRGVVAELLVSRKLDLVKSEAFSYVNKSSATLYFLVVLYDNIDCRYNNDDHDPSSLTACSLNLKARGL